MRIQEILRKITQKESLALLSPKQAQKAQKFMLTSTSPQLKHNHPDLKLDYKLVCLDSSRTASPQKRVFVVFREKDDNDFKKTRLGCGRFGKVQLAQDIDTLEWVALKVEKADSNIARERKVLKKLDRLIAVGDYTSDEKSRHFTAMELYTGDSFTKVYFKESIIATPLSKYSLEQQIDLAIQLLSELKVIHDLGYIHRDVSQHNFIVTASNDVKIIDFGTTVKAKTGKYQTEQYTGTNIAPEIKRNKVNTYSFQSDIWALGRILFMVFNDFGLFENRMQGGVVSQFYSNIKNFIIRTYYARTTAELYQFIKNLQHIDPNKRPSVDECISQLKTIKESIHPLRKLTTNCAQWLKSLHSFITKHPETSNLIQTEEKIDQEVFKMPMIQKPILPLFKAKTHEKNTAQPDIAHNKALIHRKTL